MAKAPSSTTRGLETGAVPNLQISFFISGLPSNPNKTKGHHWAKTYAENQEWKTHVYYMAKASYKGAPFKRARVHYHVSLGDNRTHDADNIIASLKSAQDGLKGTLLVDDSIDNIELSYSFDRAKPRGFQITVTPL